uniref:Uncharacterized protein n=1 Tax=Tetranychus urticae TaxID=32264 RepID=T1KGA6_TETUR
MAYAAEYRDYLKRVLDLKLAHPERKMEKLLNSILYLLLQNNNFDDQVLKMKLSAAKATIENIRNRNNFGLNNFLGESNEKESSSSPLNERLKLDRPRHLSSSTVSSSTIPSLNASPNTVIIPTNLPTGLGTVATRVSSSSSGSSSASASPFSASTVAPNVGSTVACQSLLSLAGTEYPISPVTTLPQPTIFSSSLFCPSYYGSLAGSSLSAYQTTVSRPASAPTPASTPSPSSSQ